MPRPRTPIDAAGRAHGAAGAAWPAADRFAARSGLPATEARILLAAFCGLAPDHFEGAPSEG